MTHAHPCPLGELLVVGLGFVERAGRLDLGYDLTVFIFLNLVAHLNGVFALLLVEVKNGRAVFVANIRPLPVHLRRVVHAEELFKQRFVANLFGVKLYQHCLGVASGVRANFVVRWVLGVSAGVAGSSLYDTRNLVEVILHSPKTTGCKQCLLHIYIITSAAHRCLHRARYAGIPKERSDDGYQPPYTCAGLTYHKAYGNIRISTNIK